MLKQFLEDCGASVSIVYLDSNPQGAVVGVDDFLGQGGINQLQALATSELKHIPPPPPSSLAALPYFQTQEGIFWRKPADRGTVPVQLTNFRARIIGQTEVDDGASTTHFLDIEAVHLDRLVHFSCTASEFISMGWVIPELGANATLMAGYGIRDHARTAIQLLSGNVPRRSAVGHLGWRRVSDLWVFCHAEGAIGANGVVDGIEVRISEPELAKFALPEPPTGQDLQAAIQATLRLLDIAPLHITVPLLAAIGAAPLNEMDPTDYTVQIAGITGGGKTALATLAQGHYGAFLEDTDIPVGWSSTGNAIERLAFVAKDQLLLVDDYAPQAAVNLDKLNAEVDWVVRAQANRQGRARMRSDASMAPTYSPRGLIFNDGRGCPSR